MLAFALLARYVPKPALAALLLLTATRLIETKRIVYTVRASALDAGVLAMTAVSGLALGLDQSMSDRGPGLGRPFRTARCQAQSQ